MAADFKHLSPPHSTISRNPLIAVQMRSNDFNVMRLGGGSGQTEDTLYQSGGGARPASDLLDFRK